MRSIFIGLLMLFISIPCFAGTVTRHTTYTTNSEVNATNLNGNFNNIITAVNGGLDNSNISSSAGIVGSKLDLSSPGAIGGTTPNTGAFSTLSSSGNASLGDGADTHTITGVTTFDDNGANGVCVTIDNDGTNHGLYIKQDGINASSKNGLCVESSAAQISAPLAYFNLSSTSSTQPALAISVSGSSSSVQIDGAGDENLSNAGVWTDRSSCFIDKIDHKIVEGGYIDKLRDTKLYDYRKKCEENNKVRNKRYIGIILDEPSTPEELISRDKDGNINGKSGTQIAEFTLVVCQELIKENDALKTRIDDLEKRVEKLEKP